MANPASAPPANKAGDGASASGIARPLVVIAVEKGLNAPQVEKLIKTENMLVVFARTEADIVSALQHPGCFAVFLDLEFEKNGLRIMQRNAPQAQAYWIMVTGALTTQKRSALMNAGATDILHHPVSPPQYRLRACNLLVRFLKSFDMPSEVTLPQGYNRRSELRLEKGILNPADEANRPKFVGNAESAVRGAPPTQSKTGEGSTDTRLIRGDRDLSKPAPVMLPGTPAKSATDITATASTAPAGPVGSWNPLKAASPPPRSVAPSHPATPAANQSPATTATAAKARALTPLLSKSPLTGIERSVDLLAEIRRRLVMLPSNRAFDRKLWIDSPIFHDPAFRGMEQTLRDLQQLFQGACKTLGCRRITLVSLQPDAPDTADCPATFYSLVSSEGVPQNNEPVATLTVPQLRVAFENQKSFYLDESLPSRVDGAERPATWTLAGKAERLSVIIPILRGEHTALALFIQFDVPCDERIRPKLDQAVTYLKEAERFYTVVEFFSRIYRGL